jgi:hypothetical protein
MLRSGDQGHGSGHYATTRITASKQRLADGPPVALGAVVLGYLDEILDLVFSGLSFTGYSEVKPVHLVPPGSDRASGRGTRHLEGSRKVSNAVGSHPWPPFFQ